MNKMTVRDIDLRGKRALVRVDFNVPLAITDDTRIRAALPTIRYILAQKPKAVILMSHLGRPKGQRIPQMSLLPIADNLAQKLGREVAFAEDCIGAAAAMSIRNLPDGGLLLLENTRFHRGETENDSELARQLAAHGDVFVNDAFGTAHRAHASNVGVAEHLPAVAGLLLEKEIDYLANVLENPARPFAALLGGAKVSDKIGVIAALLNKADKLLIGGGMANTFFAAQGRDMADSLVEIEALNTARELLNQAGDKLKLPLDQRIAADFHPDAVNKIIAASEDIPAGWQSLDIGPQTVESYARQLANDKTVVWNGPMGVFEMPAFAHGTFGLAAVLAEATKKGAGDHYRRRRFSRGRRTGRPGRADVAYFDRRRRQFGTAGGQGFAWPGGASGQVMFLNTRGGGISICAS